MIFKRLFKSRRLRRTLLWLFITGFAASCLATIVFVVVASHAQEDFHAINETLSAEHRARMEGIATYQRPEDATYLTFPEWYLVFNPQEYAQFLATNSASRFPYLKSIGQFWDGYAQVYGITKRNYLFNSDKHLMVVVIGTSTTFEYAVKSAYENTVGRIFEWTAGARTSEEDYAARAAKEYGDFVPTKPWFEFPFGRKFVDLWKTNDLFGKNFLRKSERKFFLSIEYGFKWAYAGIIRLASTAVYGVADTEIYATVRNVSENTLAQPGIRKVKALDEGAWIVTLPHYQGFTDIVPGLACQGVEFEEIAGNDEILVSIVTPQGWRSDLTTARSLFTMELLTGSDLQRVALQVPVKSLGFTLREIETRKLRVEHIFDY